MRAPSLAEVTVGPVPIGGGRPFTLIAGPCVIESAQGCMELAQRLQEICQESGTPLIFKASFDKANRSSIHSFRGPGLERGLEILAEIKQRLGLPITTDIHLPEQASPVAQVADLVQIPAFLCRQTDLLVAAAQTGRPVNVKKGQFLAPGDMAHVLAKLQSAGAVGAMLTERGSCHGYKDLVADLRGLPQLAALGAPVCMDATHAAQKPGGLGDRSGGDRQVAALLARAAVAVGVDALFLEVHPDPDKALSDGPNMIRLDALAGQLRVLTAIDAVVKQGAR